MTTQGSMTSVNPLRNTDAAALNRMATQSEGAHVRLAAQRELERRRTAALWARDARP